MRNFQGESPAEHTYLQTDPRQIPTPSLHSIIQELDNSYAEILSDEESDYKVLSFVWKRIRDLRAELGGRNS